MKPDIYYSLIVVLPTITCITVSCVMVCVIGRKDVSRRECFRRWVVTKPVFWNHQEKKQRTVTALVSGFTTYKLLLVLKRDVNSVFVARTYYTVDVSISCHFQTRPYLL